MNALTYLGSSDGFRLAATGVLVPAVAWLLAWSATRISRRASAATRHLIWLLSFVAMAAWVPFAVTHFKIEVPILPPKPSPPPALAPLRVLLSEEKLAPTTAISLPHFNISLPKPLPKITAAEAGGNSASASRLQTEEHGTHPALLVALWVFGFVVLALNFLAGVLDLRRVIRASRIPDDETLAALHSELCARIGLRKPPGLLISASVAVPLVTGLWRPCVILPEKACHWPTPMLRAALIHELTHVRRNDLFSAAFAHLVVAIYWFNPFAWFGLRALQAEAEMAADDGVVTLESQPVSYAENLVALVRDLRKGASSLFPAIGMLRRAGMEVRVERILNSSCRRTTPRRQIHWAAGCGVMLLAAAFAVLRPVAVAPLPSPAAAAPLQTAAKSKSVESARYILDIKHGNTGPVDSPGPGYREQRGVRLDGAGSRPAAPIMSDGSN